MPTVTTRPIVDDPLLEATLLVAFDLGNTEWTLAFAPALAVPPRLRTMPARDLPRLRTMPARDLPRLFAEFEAARRHFGLSAEAPIRTCYEAGRDGAANVLDRGAQEVGIEKSRQGQTPSDNHGASDSINDNEGDCVAHDSVAEQPPRRPIARVGERREELDSLAVGCERVQAAMGGNRERQREPQG